ncbi:MAG: hypothetical protein HY756_00970 [Nitrospirae bacterium]|nr:hypothetical protein [Nitrospirota bacterium]
MTKGQLKIFFSGIAGNGVSAIASFMADRGHKVSGSDRTFDSAPKHPLKNIFEANGITIMPQDGSGIGSNLDFAVFSTAVEDNTPEVLKAKTLGVLIKTRPEYLSEITASFKTIAVSGTSGKSTASGMLSFLMKRLGLNPNFIGGGRVKQFKTPLTAGNSIAGSSDYLVIEACESDGSIINYKPEHSIVLNLSLDHHTVEKTAMMFKSLIKNTKGKIILNADDDNLREISDKDAVMFSIHSSSGYKAEEIVFNSFNTEFSLRGERLRLSLPGEHNLYNALASIALLSELGISLQDIAKILPEFYGIERRFDIHLNDGERLVIDDYAHNPHKISSLMQTVMRIKEGVCYIFQPHGFAPTRLMKNEYIETFAENLRNKDRLILLPIFYAGGTVAKDISSHNLAEGIRAKGKNAHVIRDRKEILSRLHEFQSYVVFGARDETLSDFAGEIARCKFLLSGDTHFDKFLERKTNRLS